MNNSTEIFEQEEVIIEYYSDDEVVIEEIIYEETDNDDSSEASSYYEEEIVEDQLPTVLEEEEEESEDDEEEEWESDDDDDETPFWAKLQLRKTEKGNELRESGNLAAPITFTPFKNTDFTNKLCSPKSLRKTEQGNKILKKQEASLSSITTQSTSSLKKKTEGFTSHKLLCNPDFLKRMSAILQQQLPKKTRFASCA
jgi:hypothetical protein